MKILIGILILLFVLTTIGFSGTAFAAQTCNSLFGPRVGYSDQYDGKEYDRFDSESPAYFIESKDRPHDDRTWTDFWGPNDGEPRGEF